jgi:fermentation-respiration switch protein FrsA (DUF1100 family)
MDKKKLRRLLLGEFTLGRIIRSILFVYICLMLFAHFFADGMIFLPPPPGYVDGPGILKLTTEDGQTISAYYRANPSAKYTILHSHGNAEDIGSASGFMDMYHARGFSVMTYDYRGYGTSEGSPSERKTYRDVEAAYDYLVDELSVPASNIIIHGKSVGSGMAVHLAANREAGGLIIESAFVTAFRVRTHVPIVPFDEFANIKKIADVECPILFIHGKQDRTVPFWHGEKLFEKATAPKMHLWVETAGHNDLLWEAGEDYWVTIAEFVEMVETNTAR